MRRIIGIVGAVLAVAGATGATYWLYVRPQTGQQEQARPPPAVVLTEAGQARIERTIEAIGTVRAAESIVVAARLNGTIEKIGFGDGDVVQEGDVLVRLVQGELQAEVNALEAEANEIAQSLARSQELLSRGVAPRATVADAQRRLEAARARTEAARQRLSDTVLTAPFAGRVGLRNLSVGALVQAGAELVTLDSISPIDVRFSVPEQQLGDLRIGAPVEAQTAAYESRRFEGSVRAIDSRVDPALRTVEVEARLPNPDGALRPGMLMRVSATVRIVENAVVVPPIAVVVQGDEHYVWRVVDGRAQRATVAVGQREPERLEIVSGLAVGDRIVVEGLQYVTDGQPVRVLEAKEATQEPTPGAGAPR